MVALNPNPRAQQEEAMFEQNLGEIWQKKHVSQNQLFMNFLSLKEKLHSYNMCHQSAV